MLTVNFENGVAVLKLPSSQSQTEVVTQAVVTSKTTYSVQFEYKGYKSRQYYGNGTAVIQPYLPASGLTVTIRNLSDSSVKYATIDLVTAEAQLKDQKEYDAGPVTIRSTAPGVLVLMADKLKRITIRTDEDAEPEKYILPDGTQLEAIMVTPSMVVEVEFEGKLRTELYA